MSVEDIDFLYQNSVTEDIIILVDSDKRDKMVWHEPNNFQIDFVEPFKLVCGVDVLDINIPRTMYSIESHNNILKFKHGTGINWGDFTSYLNNECDVRDYTFQELLNELNIISGNLYLNNIAVSADTSTNENRKSVLEFTNSDNPPKPFIFDMTHSTIANILGFDEIATGTKPHLYTNFSNLNVSLNNPRLFASVPINKRTYELTSTRSALSPSTISLRTSNNLVQELRFHDTVILDDMDLVDDLQMFANISHAIDNAEDKYNGFFIHGVTIDSHPSSTSFHHDDMTFHTKSGVRVIVPIDTIEPRLKVQYYKVDLTNSSGNMSDLLTTHRTAINLLESSSSTLLANVTLVSPAFFLTKNGDAHTYSFHITDEDYNHNIFNLIPIQPFANIAYFMRVEFDINDYRQQFLSQNRTIIDAYIQKHEDVFDMSLVYEYINAEFLKRAQCELKTNDSISSTYVSAYDTDLALSASVPGTISSLYHISYTDHFRLTAPGLVKLMGERYVTIHCDNIENHLRGSNMFNDYSPGMALVNLGVVGYSHQRMDFFSVKYKRFHPIGKLNNLRFTVKRSGNLLYDLKGVNWHMLLSIKYYVPRMKSTFTRSSLNPNYDYDYMKYANKYINKYTTGDSDNDDDDNDESSHVDRHGHHFDPSQCLKKERELQQQLTYENELTSSEEDCSSNDDSSDGQ